MSGSVSSSSTGSASSRASYQGTLTDRSRTVSATWVSGGKRGHDDSLGIWGVQHQSIRRRRVVPMTETPSLLAETPRSRSTNDLFRTSTLEHLRLDGAIFFRSELTEPLRVRVDADDPSPARSHPGAERLIAVPHRRRGLVLGRVDDGVRHWAGDGRRDRAALRRPTPDRRRRRRRVACSILTLLDPPPWIGAAGGPPRRRRRAHRRRLRLPALHRPVVRPGDAGASAGVRGAPPDGTGGGWVQASIDYALATPRRRRTSPSTVVDAACPSWCSSRCSGSPRHRAGRRPRLARRAARSGPRPGARAAAPRPARRWTVAELRRAVGVSRSSLDERFRQVLGRSPIRYLTEWRMHLADDLLRRPS